MKGLQEVAYLLVCLAWEMLALAKTLSFPDIPQPSWPRELGQWSRAPALLVMCGVVGRKNQIMKLVSLLGLPGSFLPITGFDFILEPHFL